MLLFTFNASLTLVFILRIAWVRAVISAFVALNMPHAEM